MKTSILLLALILSACGGGSSTPEAPAIKPLTPAEQCTIEYQLYRTSLQYYTQCAALEALVTPKPNPSICTKPVAPTC